MNAALGLVIAGADGIGVVSQKTLGVGRRGQ